MSEAFTLPGHLPAAIYWGPKTSNSIELLHNISSVGTAAYTGVLAADLPLIAGDDRVILRLPPWPVVR